jgi:hypothetical protein
VFWEPGSGRPGLIITQPDRLPVDVSPPAAGRGGRWLLWLLVLLIIVLLAIVLWLLLVEV